MLCVVLRPFKGNGTDFVRNQVVDASQFRNASALIQLRMLRQATQDELESASYEDVPTESVPTPKRKGKLRIRRRKRK